MSVVTFRARPAKDPEPEPLRDYSSIQVEITGTAAEKMRRMAAEIPDRDIGPDGREQHQHITAKWGLHFQSPSKRLREALEHFGPVKATFGKSSLFSNDDADVLKIDIDSPDLHRLNKVISRLVPTHDTHPKYVAHATIAYCKPGRGQKYAGNTSLDGMKATFNSVTFSSKLGPRETIPLTMPAAVSYRAR